MALDKDGWRAKARKGAQRRAKARKGAQRRGGLMVSALDSGASAPSSSPGRGHSVEFLSKTLHSHSASLHPGPGCSKTD